MDPEAEVHAGELQQLLQGTQWTEQGRQILDLVKDFEFNRARDTLEALWDAIQVARDT